MFQTEGATLQHLESKSLTRVSIYIHGHNSQRKLSCILHLETLSNGEEWLIGAQAWGGNSHSHSGFLCFCFKIELKYNFSHRPGTPWELTVERWSAERLRGRATCRPLWAPLWPHGPAPSSYRRLSGCFCNRRRQNRLKAQLGLIQCLIIATGSKAVGLMTNWAPDDEEGCGGFVIRGSEDHSDFPGLPGLQ